MSFSLWKMQGCGNDFLLYDGLKEHRGFSVEQIKYLCHRQFGMGADGFVLLKPSVDYDAEWEFFNNDGSVAEMCGNASRCVIRFLTDRYFQDKEQVKIKTLVGVLEGKKLTHDTVEAKLPSKVPSELHEKVLTVEGNAVQIYFVNTGVPHAVIEVKDIHSYPIVKYGHLIQKHAAFQPEETNVTFFQKVSFGKVLATTYERGVEAETLACGTGAAAVALVATQLYQEPYPLQVLMPGGALTVSVVNERVHLVGKAEYVSLNEYFSFPDHLQLPKPYSEKRKNV